MTEAKIILVAHCILNRYSSVKGLKKNETLARELIKLAIDGQVGIIQLPCPECTLLGARRWAQSYEQYDTPYFHDHCLGLLDTPLKQAADHLAAGSEILALVGVAGSPSCSVYENTSAEYGGVLPGMKADGPTRLPPSTRVPRQGHFIQIAQKQLRRMNIHIPLLELPRHNCPAEDAEAFISHLTSLIER